MSGHLLQQLAAQQAQPQMQLATPFNDTQLVAFLAGSIYASRTTNLTFKEVVSQALDIVAEAIVQMPTIGSRVEAAKARRQVNGAK
jgi:hypothetical protein